VLPALAADPRWHLLGHGHPRLWGTIRRRWAQLEVDHTGELADVLDRADLLVGDNTSALYEFASTGRPVVVVNAPWYRRDVHHGLRFWDHPPGVQVDRPEDLAPSIARALTDPPALRRIRAAAVERAYAHADGLAAHRAATAIAKELLPCRTRTPPPTAAG
jgi:CDP-glycerol glycerophosphotransferase (TagB/SpsB family)